MDGANTNNMVVYEAFNVVGMLWGTSPTIWRCIGIQLWINQKDLIRSGISMRPKSIQTKTSVY